MRTVVLILMLLHAASGQGYAQEERYMRYDYGDIGLAFMVPASWEHDGLRTTTKAAFIKLFGWNYDREDADDLWSAVGSFSSITVDSTLLPSDAALDMHKMTLFVNRAHTLYRRWLCLHRRNSIFEAKPIVNGKYQLIQKDRVSRYDLPPGLSDANGHAYTYDAGQVDLLTYGHVFTFVHQEKCYELRIESTTADPPGSLQMHERILNSFERFSF